jgi:hypothetical protein
VTARPQIQTVQDKMFACTQFKKKMTQNAPSAAKDRFQPPAAQQGLTHSGSLNELADKEFGQNPRTASR